MSVPFLGALFAALTAHATSVTPPTFSQLVSEADAIARATVSSVESHWVDGPQGRVIKTFVTFSVDKVLKGSPANPLTLEFLGGTVGTDVLHVAGMPEFTVGQHEIVFVQGNGLQFCPLVRFGHGRYHVRTDANSRRAYVTRNDESPLTATSDVQLPAEAHESNSSATVSSASALTPEQFETAITAEARKGK
jgi:hypothetical protein